MWHIFILLRLFSFCTFVARMWVGVFGVRLLYSIYCDHVFGRGRRWQKKAPFILKSNVSDVLQMRAKHSHNRTRPRHVSARKSKEWKRENWRMEKNGIRFNKNMYKCFVHRRADVYWRRFEKSTHVQAHRSCIPFSQFTHPMREKKNCSCRRRSHRHQSRQSTPIAQLRRAQLVFIDILLHYLFIYLWFSHVRTNVRTTSMTLESLKHFATVDKETSSLPSSHFHRRRASVCVC